LISEEDVVRLSKEVIDVIEQNQLTVTFFEIITMIAFLKFKEEKIDYAVLECGLGGRLDATNIVYPEVCAITSVGWDHVEALGDTL
jgi:dihydrofolate synthase/folylpolyglutamate synthase